MKSSPNNMGEINTFSMHSGFWIVLRIQYSCTCILYTVYMTYTHMYIHTHAQTSLDEFMRVHFKKYRCKGSFLLMIEEF